MKLPHQNSDNEAVQQNFAPCCGIQWAETLDCYVVQVQSLGQQKKESSSIKEKL